MVDLVQAVYISRASFKPTPAAGGVEPHVARILQQSRANNPRLGLGGVLYYGEGFFFQCLEGDPALVRSLLDKIGRDERHRDMKVVLQEPIERRRFDSWSMKYIPTSDTVKSLLARKGYSRFDPYSFDRPMIDAMLAAFQNLNADPEGKDGAGPSDTRREWQRMAVPAAALVMGVLVAGLLWL